MREDRRGGGVRAALSLDAGQLRITCAVGNVLMAMWGTLLVLVSA
jgi:hypothetical protein